MTMAENSDNTLSTGQKLDTYLACGIAEGFEEGNWTKRDQLLAWQYIGRTGLYRQLQGLYGRTLQRLLDEGYFDKDFNILTGGDE